VFRLITVGVQHFVLVKSVFIFLLQSDKPLIVNRYASSSISIIEV